MSVAALAANLEASSLPEVQGPPKGLKDNIAWRLEWQEKAKADPAVQVLLRDRCRQDIHFYIDGFVCQYNPRKKGRASVGPFVTWDFQDQAIKTVLWCIENDEDLLIEKSREMGASWLCLIVMEWLWHFHPWQKFLCISRNEEAVESEDPDSLFWKIDFIHRYLPGWLLPPMTRRKRYFGNQETHSTITGQASTGKAGVGGRATAMFIDEFSQVKEDYEVLHRTSDTTGCRIFNGTHRGIGTAFHELSQRVDMRKLMMHWTQHPDKRPGLYKFDGKQVIVLDKQFRYPADFNFVLAEAPAGGPFPGLRSPWYDRECVRKGSPRAVAMDLDIDAGGSVAQFFNPLTIRELRGFYARPPLWEGDIAFDAEAGKPIRLVQNEGGLLKLWVHPRPDGGLPEMKGAAGADLATGSGATPTCLSVMNAVTGEKVLEYASAHVLPERFAAMCAAILWLFKDQYGSPPLFAWEHAGPGLVFAKFFLLLGYPNIYYRESGVGTNFVQTQDCPGWYPQNDQKRVLLDEYRAALDARECINYSDLALAECLPYRWTAQGFVEHPHDSGKSDDPTGARVNHGDRVIADALAWKMVKTLGLLRASEKKDKDQIRVGTLAWRKKLHDDERRRRQEW